MCCPVRVPHNAVKPTNVAAGLATVMLSVVQAPAAGCANDATSKSSLICTMLALPWIGKALAVADVGAVVPKAVGKPVWVM